MTEPSDALPMAVRYDRQAQAAVAAAKKALGSSYSTEERAATIEATGRLAVALILADREQP